MVAGDENTIAVYPGSILTVTTVNGDAYVNPISAAGVVGETTRVWASMPSATFGPFSTVRNFKVSCLLGEASVSLTLFEPQSADSELSRSYVKDDFIGGSLTLFAGEIGELGWFGNQLGSGAVAIPVLAANELHHPGVKRLTTGTTINSQAWIQLPSTTPLNLFLIDARFDLQFIVNLRHNDVNTKAAFGLGTTPAPAALSGVRIEKQFADEDWYALTGNGSSTTRQSLGAVVAAQWERFRIRRIDSSSIGFSRNGGTEVAINTTMLDPGTGVCLSVYIENDATADKHLDVDYVDCLLTSITR